MKERGKKERTRISPPILSFLSSKEEGGGEKRRKITVVRWEVDRRINGMMKKGKRREEKTDQCRAAKMRCAHIRGRGRAKGGFS